MENRIKADRSQLVAVGFCALLSPAIRTLPVLALPDAGVHAWLSALAALPPMLLLVLYMQRFLRSLGPEESMADLFPRILGKWPGRVLLLIFGLWMLFYAAFVMRNAAHRFISTIFPDSSPAAYIPIMGLMALITVLGPFRVLARMAEIIRPVLVFVLVVVLVFALPEVKLNTFYLPRAAEVLPIFRGALPVLNAVSILSYLSFMEDSVGSSKGLARSWAGCIVLTALLLSALCLTTVGCFGPVLTERINNPFFVMIRNIRILNTLERVEALVIALWFFTDFFLVSAMVHAGGAALSRALGLQLQREQAGLFSGGRWLLWLCTLGSTLCALWIAPTTRELGYLSLELVPALNLFFCLLVLPALFLLGLIRRRI